MTDGTPNPSMPRKVRVAVLFGGQSDEHDVSLRSAQTIMEALDPERYEVVPVGITREGQWVANGDPLKALQSISPMFALKAGDEAPGDVDAGLSTDVVAVAVGGSGLPAGLTETVDIVFPALHGPKGEDGTVQGMLELAGVPYIGSGVLGSAVAMDKVVTKNLLTQAGLPQVPWVQVLRRDWERDQDAIEQLVGERLGYPCFVKPANMGSSVGVGKARNPAELHDALREASRFDRKLVIEQGVNAREIELAVLGNDDPIVSVAGEVVPAGEFYDYNAKYIDDDAQLIIPARLDREVLAYMQELAIAAFQALDLAGLARVDFFLEKETDRVFINEVNTIPGFTSISMYPMLWEASGVPLAELVDRLVQLGVERSRDGHR
ncbi:MAG TPA: D-alanine--D-alanine ligase [Thermomicrobiales bacterium]|nr:D-alanine--D-alanine ligase [Thermomicrobiales bacterium]